MAVQESQHLQLAEGFYANALKPMLDICVGDVDVFLSNHVNLVSAAVAKHARDDDPKCPKSIRENDLRGKTRMRASSGRLMGLPPSGRLAREPIDVHPLRELEQCVARHGRTHNLAFEHE